MRSILTEEVIYINSKRKRRAHPVKKKRGARPVKKKKRLELSDYVSNYKSEFHAEK